MPEISDADNELLKLAKKTLGNTKTRMPMLRTLKEADPEAAIPELDQEARIDERMKPLHDENKRLRDDLAARDAASGLKEQRNGAEQLLKAKGLKHTIADVEKVMVEKGITTHAVAIEHMDLNARSNPPAPASGKSARVEIPNNEALAKDPSGWARDTAAAVIDELRGIKR